MGEPVFIMAPCQRSGTNWLAHVLTECGPFEMTDTTRLPGEDWLLQHANHLMRYCTGTVGEWRGKWQPWTHDESRLTEAALALAQELGRGILRYVAGGADQGRWLFHTPSVRNLALCGYLFPNAKTVVMVRDGRDVVESATGSWPHTTAETWARRWATGVDELLKAVAADDHGRICVLKYEELYDTPEQAIGRVETHLGLPAGSVDLERVSQLPIFGSSRHSNGGEWNWSVRQKTDEFRPVGRWKTWALEKVQAFEAIAGQQLRALEYTAAERSIGPSDASNLKD